MDAVCPVVDEVDDVLEGGVVAEGEVVVAFDAVAVTDGGERFGLFDGVDSQVGFQVQVEVEHLGWIAGLFGHHRQHRVPHLIHHHRSSGRSRNWFWLCRFVASRLRCLFGDRARSLDAVCPVVDEVDDVLEGGVVAEGEVVVAFDAVTVADGGEGFGLFDGVDSEVGFQVEVEVEHLGWVAGLFGHHRQHRVPHLIHLCRSCRGRCCLRLET